MSKIEGMTPKEIVEALDKYIIGQNKAKKSVAIALRNRMRRAQLPEEIKDEVAPKNIIMIGPTGVGKTEIARRLAKLARAPFIKVEATKFTEVGYVGRDVESMVRDLLSSAISMVKTEMKEGVEEKAKEATEEQLLDLLLPGTGNPADKKINPIRPGSKPNSIQIGAITIGPDGMPKMGGTTPPININQDQQKPEEPKKEETAEEKSKKEHLREVFRKKLRDGELEDKMIEIKVTRQNVPMMEIFSGSSMDDMDMNVGAFNNLFSGKGKIRKVTVKQARDILMGQQTDKLIDNDGAVETAKELVENMGIIFIDEIDKIATRQGTSGGQDVSREGVQRDILPIVEGSTVNTKHGMIDTSHILFIAAGAFSVSKPSDLIPELQGRFPLRVELDDLNADDFEEILSSPKNALTTQYIELLKTEEIELEFDKTAIRKLAEIAAEVNSNTENIGARRLHTIMELLLEEISFEAPDKSGEKILVDTKYVEDRLSEVSTDRDLSRYIL